MSYCLKIYIFISEMPIQWMWYCVILFMMICQTFFCDQCFNTTAYSYIETRNHIRMHAFPTLTSCERNYLTVHYGDVIMGAIASPITSLTIVYSTVYSEADQRKHQSSASLAFVRGIHQGPVNSPHKWPVTRKMFPFDDVIVYDIVHGNYYLSFLLLSLKADRLKIPMH